MSLYKHVASKDDLLDGIVEQLWSEIPIDPPDGDCRQDILCVPKMSSAQVSRVGSWAGRSRA